jgi:hypothetical protein
MQLLARMPDASPNQVVVELTRMWNMLSEAEKNVYSEREGLMRRKYAEEISMSVAMPVLPGIQGPVPQILPMPMPVPTGTPTPQPQPR